MAVTVTATGPTVLRTFTLPDASAKILTNAAVVLTSEGGTGVATLNAHGVVLGNGASAVNVTSAGTAGQALTSNGSSADPTFGPIKQTTTSTGTQNNFVLTPGASVLRCNNATLLTITGIAAGFDGQRLILESVGAGQVDLVHQSASSSVGNKLLNFATSGNTSLAAGVGTAEFEYDATTGSWRLIAHEQGAWITPTYASGNFTGDVTTWTVDSGDILGSGYLLRGRTLHVIFSAQTTSTGAATNTALRVGNGAWGSFTAARDVLIIAMYNDNLGGLTAGFMQVGPASSATLIAFKKFTGTFAAATNTTAVYGEIVLEVT
jgi:hypothetical protein